MRSAAKTVLYLLAYIAIGPLALIELLARSIFSRDVFFAGQAEFLSLFPGKSGSILRNVYYHLTLRRCPLHCSFLIGSMFTHSQAEVGQRVYVGAHCILGWVNLGDDSLLADHVYVLSGKHQHGTSDSEVRFQDQPGVLTCVRIGTNSWVGTNSVVMADIGEDCIIGASSVVNKEIPSGHVAVGNPAKVVRPTFPDEKAAARKSHA